MVPTSLPKKPKLAWLVMGKGGNKKQRRLAKLTKKPTGLKKKLTIVLPSGVADY